VKLNCEGRDIGLNLIVYWHNLPWFVKLLKSDVESTLKLLNFAIYHTELTEMEGREREKQRKQQADGGPGDDGHHDNNNDDHPNVTENTER